VRSRARPTIDRPVSGWDPSAARATLGDAAGPARETLEDLRALSGGIAPRVLVDRGLAAVLAAMNTAYFVVSEALANVAEHSDASTSRVEVRCADGRLRVVVEDDGTGGALLAPGHGLAGLTDRLTAVDGVLTVDSPRGGPTRLTAELPCG
jgi:signal transduction histidine kinase